MHREGVDIVLAVDVSGSMLAEDFTLGNARANRLAVVKSVVRDFVASRPVDRIGLVLFGARAYTQCPLTLDHGWLLQNLERAEVGMIEDGTAIGAGLATAVNRLRASTAKSKLVVLLTDGQQNAGRTTPQTAAEAAAALGIKVYTVGAGTRGMAPFPATDLFGNKVYRPMQVDVDEDTLKKVATATGGRYFRATDTQSLRDIYAEIDRAVRAVDQRSLGDHLAPFSSHRLDRLAAGEAGGDDVLHHQHFRSGFEPEAAAQFEGAGRAFEEHRVLAQRAAHLVADDKAAHRRADHRVDLRTHLARDFL